MKKKNDCKCHYPTYRAFCVCTDYKWVCPYGCKEECRCGGATYVKYYGTVSDAEDKVNEDV